MLKELFALRYADLVRAWLSHQDLRSRRVPVAELADSRLRLDRLRDETNALRRAHAPEPHEAEDALLTTYCDRFAETVFLFTADADWSSGVPRFRCVCGDPVDGEGARVRSS